MEPSNLLTGPDTWWSSANLLRHAARYAALAVGLTLLTWLVLALSGVSPYGRRGWLSWPLLMWCVVAGLATYRRRRDTVMGFRRALQLAAAITGLAAVGSAVVLVLFVLVAPAGLLIGHQAELRAMLEANRAQLIKLNGGVAAYQQSLATVANISATSIALDDLIRRLFVGLVTGLLAAILLRKATPDDAEPERAPRPPGV